MTNALNSNSHYEHELNTTISSTMNDKQHVFNLLNQAEHPAVPLLSRRSFCTLTGLSLISFFMPSCSASKNNTSLKALGQEVEFEQFFDVVFPASNLSLIKYRNTSQTRIQNITNQHALDVIQLYKHFKARLWLKRDLGTKEYNRTLGVSCLADMLNSKHADKYNHALDIIYYELSKENKLLTALWGRRFSLYDKKCVYWDSYDQAVS